MAITHRCAPTPATCYASTAVSYLLSDHLGSTAVTANASGGYATELRYYPYGGTRYNPGSQVTTDPSLHSGLHRPALGQRHEFVLLWRPLVCLS